ncbi:unnamed protein product [Bursaphelenchus xylophilus]|uniref:Partner of Y14 and mago n=1 Tax=Bursaphelenchus xylophilus TaxID=6326 RepID=A0A1I7SCV4_BURXY|nr:unnamed protein product [Bursaphelenchus xylophilus]CAG9093419.1 unnamed protein product [Bursaphelenchus xylophilus]
MSGAAGGDRRVKTSNGETYIPASQRPDGTWRKPLKVKEGYIPADERPRFQCRAQREAEDRASKPKFPVGWSPKELQKEAKKVADEKKKRAEMPVAAVESKNVPVTQSDHIQKKIHGLKKKLDDIDKIQKRIDTGELKNPEKTQLEKIERRPVITDEIEKLTAELENLAT